MKTGVNRKAKLREAAKTAPSPRYGPRGPRVPAVLAMLGFAFFAVSAVVLPLFSEYGLVEDYISELAIGRHGYVQTAAFFASGLGSLALAFGLRGTTRGVRGSRLGPVLVVLFGVGVVLAGIFPTDAIDAEGQLRSQTASGTVHFAAALLAYVVGIAAMLVLSSTFGRDARWRSFWPFSLALAFAALAMSLTLFFLPVPNADQWAGLYQRVFVGTVVLWLMLAAVQLYGMAAAPPTRRASKVG